MIWSTTIGLLTVAVFLFVVGGAYLFIASKDRRIEHLEKVLAICKEESNTRVDELHTRLGEEKKEMELLRQVNRRQTELLDLLHYRIRKATGVLHGEGEENKESDEED